MKTCILFMLFLLFAPRETPPLQYVTHAALVQFRSETPLMVLESNNYFADFQFDSGSGQLSCEVPVRLFEFDMPMMKTHFNTYFMDSGNFPQATFTGWIQNLRDVNFEKDGDYPIQVKGDLTIRGVTRQVYAPGRVEVKKRLPTLHGNLEIALSDYGVPYPEFVQKKISDRVQLTIVARCAETAR